MNNLCVQDYSSYKPDFGDKLGAELGKSINLCRDKMKEIETRYTDYSAMRSWLHFLKMSVNEVNEWIDKDSQEWKNIRAWLIRLERLANDLTKYYGRKVIVIYGVRLLPYDGPINTVSYTFKRGPQNE